MWCLTLATNAVVTWTLVGINVLIFLVEVARPNLLYEWGMLGTPALSNLVEWPTSRLS